MSIFFAGPVGAMSKSNISIGIPRVMHAFGILIQVRSQKSQGGYGCFAYVYKPTDVTLDWGAREH